jgi:hypothetical protein
MIQEMTFMKALAFLFATNCCYFDCGGAMMVVVSRSNNYGLLVFLPVSHEQHGDMLMEVLADGEIMKIMKK